MTTSLRFLLSLSLLSSHSSAFSGVLFQEHASLQKFAPSCTKGVDIELPDFDELFGRIQQVSPLCRQVIQGGSEPKGLKSVDDHSLPVDSQQWKNVEMNRQKTVHQLDKIDNFDGKAAPLLRFRASLNGPCLGECMANFIMKLDDRKKWDPQIADVKEIYPIYDLDSANIAMGFGRYGDCSRLGIGHCQTKKGLGISPREQLTICGIQDFEDGSCVIWGTEMAERHNYLFPEGPRHTRAKSHLFAITVTPTSDTAFDVEYVLQIDIGGKLPQWLTTPIVIDSVKSMFRVANDFFSDSSEGSALSHYRAELAERTQNAFADRSGLLMTP